MAFVSVGDLVGGSQVLVAAADAGTPEHGRGYTDMLRDGERNAKYAAAIAHAVEAAAAVVEAEAGAEAGANLEQRDGDDSRPDRMRSVHVVDIGTGTGLLAMMAADAGAAHVTAFELYPPMADVAEACIDANGFSSRVHVARVRSTDVGAEFDHPALPSASPFVASPGEARASVCVSEILDSPLLGEGVLASIRHARDILMTTTDGAAFFVPAAADVYAQLVASPVMAAGLTSPDPGCPGYVVPQSVRADAFHRAGALHPVSRPSLVTSIDLANPLDEDAEGAAVEVVFEMIAAGGAAVPDAVADVILLWWDLELAPGVRLSTAPDYVAADGGSPSSGADGRSWRDHWMQVAARMPSGAISDGGSVTLSCTHNDYTWWWWRRHGDHAQAETVQPASPPVCTCDLHTLEPPERLYDLSTAGRHDRTCDAVMSAIDGAGDSVSGSVLVVGESAGLAAAVAALDIPDEIKVKLLTRDHWYASRVMATRGGAVATVGDWSGRRAVLSAGTVVAVVGEPYFRELHGTAHPFPSLHWWWAAAELVAAAVEAGQVAPVVFPRFGRISAALVSLDDGLAASFEPVGEVAGYDLAAFSERIPIRRLTRLPLGQYETTLLSDLTPLVEVDVAAGSGPVDLRAEASIVVDRAVPAGTSLAVALPLVWGDGSDEEPSIASSLWERVAVVALGNSGPALEPGDLVVVRLVLVAEHGTVEVEAEIKQ